MEPKDSPTPEKQTAARSLGAGLIQTAELVGEGTVAGVTGAYALHWLQSHEPAEKEPPPPQVELPPGVHPEE
jgi:hypothetical protein